MKEHIWKTTQTPTEENPTTVYFCTHCGYKRIIDPRSEATPDFIFYLTPNHPSTIEYTNPICK